VRQPFQEQSLSAASEDCAVGAASEPKGRRGDCRHPTTAKMKGYPAEKSNRRRDHKQQRAEAADIHGQKLNSANFIDLGNARR